MIQSNESILQITCSPLTELDTTYSTHPIAYSKDHL